MICSFLDRVGNRHDKGTRNPARVCGFGIAPTAARRGAENKRLCNRPGEVSRSGLKHPGRTHRATDPQAPFRNCAGLCV